MSEIKMSAEEIKKLKLAECSDASVIERLADTAISLAEENERLSAKNEQLKKAYLNWQTEIESYRNSDSILRNENERLLRYERAWGVIKNQNEKEFQELWAIGDLINIEKDCGIKEDGK